MWLEIICFHGFESWFMVTLPLCWNAWFGIVWILILKQMGFAFLNCSHLFADLVILLGFDGFFVLTFLFCFCSNFSHLFLWAWLGVKSQLEYLQQCLPGEVAWWFAVVFCHDIRKLAYVVVKTISLIEGYKCIQLWKRRLTSLVENSWFCNFIFMAYYC